MYRKIMRYLNVSHNHVMLCYATPDNIWEFLELFTSVISEAYARLCCFHAKEYFGKRLMKNVVQPVYCVCVTRNQINDYWNSSFYFLFILSLALSLDSKKIDFDKYLWRKSCDLAKKKKINYAFALNFVLLLF